MMAIISVTNDVAQQKAQCQVDKVCVFDLVQLEDDKSL